jgi:hypothetical protein
MPNLAHTNKQLAKSRTSPAMILADERRKRLLELRMQGKTFKQIARETGLSLSNAKKIVCEVVKDRTAEMDDLVRHQQELSLMRLDRMVEALWPRASEGHVESVQAMIRVEERRAKLCGLDAPQRIQADVDLHALPQDELIAIAAQIGLATVMLAGGTGPVALPALGPKTVEATDYSGSSTMSGTEDSSALS